MMTRVQRLVEMDDERNLPRTDVKALVVSEARLRRAQRVARLGSWELDLATRTMWGSDEAFRIYGLAPTPDRSLPYEVVKHIPLPENREELDRALRALLTDGTPYEIRFRIRRHDDGAMRHIHSFAEATHDALGRAALVTGTIQDVTEYETAARALQDALRANEERARLTLEQAADAIFIARPGSGFVLVNEQACHLTGYERDELLGRDFRILFSAAVLAQAPLRQDLLDRGATVVSERILTRRDGREVLIEMRSKRLSDGTFQSIVRDISERRHLEEQLFFRQRMDSLGTLAGGIAHDFNNILAAIMGYADTLRLSGELIEESQKRSVEGILQSCNRAADLVRGLQRLTHPEPHETQGFDVHAIASEVFRVLSETTDRIIAKEMQIPRGMFPVHGDASGLYHALMNLGINAIQAIEEKGARVGDVVRIDACDYLAGPDDPLGLEEGSYVHVTFSDSGVGMTPEVQQHAFDPLFTTKEKGERKGQGLGLTAVYNVVVRHHQGHVRIESSVGRGTDFHLYLPRGTWAQAGPGSDVSPLRGGHETILVVEDEHEIVAVIREFLEELGYSVLAALDGQEGVALFRQHMEEIDLILLDLTLPRVSGEELLRQVLSLRPGVKVVVSSGDPTLDATSIPRLERILQKPYSLSVLSATIREALDESKGQGRH